MKKSATRQNGAIQLILVAVIISLAISAFIWFRDTGTSSRPVSSLPPVSQRTNPEPTNPNRITVSEVAPGSTVIVEEVELEQDGYIVVKKDDETGAALGKSTLLSAGRHTGVRISTKELADGDVIFIVLQSKAGQLVTDANENSIAVVKNVGMAMGHYDPSEY